MTKTQLRRALKKVPNISEFAIDHEIPIRTLWRLRRPDASPTRTTIARVTDALVKDGILTKEEAGHGKKPRARR